MLSVHLHDLEFYAFHGLYEAERIIGNNYKIDLTVTYDENLVSLSSIDSVINYEIIYEIVRKRMAIPSALLEEVAETILSKIRHQYALIAEISISIYKLQPPIENFKGKAGITLLKRYPPSKVNQ